MYLIHNFIYTNFITPQQTWSCTKQVSVTKRMVFPGLNIEPWEFWRGERSRCWCWPPHSAPQPRPPCQPAQQLTPPSTTSISTPAGVVTVDWPHWRLWLAGGSLWQPWPQHVKTKVITLKMTRPDTFASARGRVSSRAILAHHSPRGSKKSPWKFPSAYNKPIKSKQLLGP